MNLLSIPQGSSPGPILTIPIFIMCFINAGCYFFEIRNQLRSHICRGSYGLNVSSKKPKASCHVVTAHIAPHLLPNIPSLCQVVYYVKCLLGQLFFLTTMIYIKIKCTNYYSLHLWPCNPLRQRTSILVLGRSSSLPDRYDKFLRLAPM